MSKERARARGAREHEAALRAAARACAAERAERSAARARLLRRTTGRRPARRLSTLERRRRSRTSMLVACLLAVDVLVWAIRPDWPARLGIVVLSLLAAPLLLVLVARR